MLSRVADYIYGFISPLIGVLHKIGAVILTAMMLLMGSDVLMRYVFDKPIKGAFDITEYAMGLLITFVLAYGVYKKSLIRVDLISERLSPKTQAIMDSLGRLLALGIFSLITWQNFLYMLIEAEENVRSAILNVPRYPFIGFMSFGLLCLVLVLLADFFYYLSKAVKR